MFGVSRKLVPGGGVAKGEVTKRNRYGSLHRKNILMRFGQLYSVL